MFVIYSGYRGTVERIDQFNFVISGELAVLSPTKIEITELPVDVPTENYKKSVLEKLLCGSEEFPPVITDYQEHHTDNTVRFVVTMTEKMMQQVESEGFHRAFKLQSVYSLRSMLLYDSNGSLKTYNSVDDIMNEFYEVRLELYRKRRDYFSGKVEALRARLVNQNNFLTEISSKVLIVDSEKVCVI
jgi:DNA topoisomerase-2